MRVLIAIVAAIAIGGPGLAGCGGDDLPADTRVAVGSKGFVESDVVAAAYAEALRRVGLDASVVDLGSTAAAASALARDRVQLYPEYTGTVWTSLLGLDSLALLGSSRPDQERRVRARLSGDSRFHVFATAPGSNNAVAACRADSGLRSLADTTGKAVRVAGTREVFTRPDAGPAIEQAYAMRIIPVPTGPDDRYAPVRSGEAECIAAYETDPEIRQLGLRVLADPKGLLARGVDYRVVPIANGQWWRSLSGGMQARVTSAIDNVSHKMTTAWLRQANRRVSVGGEEPADLVLELVNISVPGRAAAGD